MADSVVGALRVTLGLDSAQFATGLKQSQSRLSAFGKMAGVALAGLAVAAAGAAFELGKAVKASIDHADELGKTAQKVGIAVEALSRLEFAAKLSDVSLEELAGGLRKISVNMQEVAKGSTGPAATAFNALGISVKNADGSLRGADAVFSDVAERFGRMEDGATKTAIAVALFGKSGADLIPLLNSGADGLAQMAVESDRLGATISTGTSKAAEQFNDNLTRLGAVMEGLANRIAEAVLPSLVSLTNTMASPEFQGAISATVGLFVGLVDILAKTAALAYEIANVLPKAVGAGEDAAVRALPGQQAMIDKANGVSGSASPSSAPVAASVVTVAPFVPVFKDLAGAASAASKATSDAALKIKATMAEGKSVFDATRTSAEKYTIEVERLNGLLSAGAINQDTYNRAVRQAQDSFDVARQSANHAGEAFRDTFSDLVHDAFRGKLGIDSLADALGNVGDKLLDIGLNLAFSGLTGGLGGGGGGLGGLLGGLFGFKDGGSFRVGGSGGIDSQLVAFKASPNERVTVSRDGEGDRSVGGHITANVEVGVRNGELVPLVTGISGQVAGRAVEQGTVPTMARYQAQRSGSDYRLA